MNIVRIVNGYLEENCYIVHNNKNALIIDPGSELSKIIDNINSLKLNVVGILITHYHFDHVGVLEDLNKIYKVKIYDYNNIGLCLVSDFKFKIIKNYGHTLDSVSFYFEKDKIMFTGDFVFKETIGNYDEENESIMYSSLKEFSKLDKDIIIYPGHGEKSSIGYELKHNPFLRGI